MNDFIRTLLVMSMSGGILCAAVITLSRLMRDLLPKTAQFWLWIAVITAFLVPFPMIAKSPAVSSVMPATPISRTVENVAEEFEAFPVSGPAAPAEPSGSPTNIKPDTSRPGGMDILHALYIAGAGATAAYFAAGYLLLAKKLRSSRVRVEAADSPVPVFKSREAASPMLFGLVRPAVYIPGHDYGDARMRAILSHELMHLRRKDLPLKWLCALACALHWFNPLVWLARSEAEKACELACDEAVIRSLDAKGRQEYGEALICVAADSVRVAAVLSTAMSGGAKPLKARLAAIKSYRKHPAAAFAVSAVLIAAALTAALSLGAGSGTGKTDRDLSGFGVNGYALGKPAPAVEAYGSLTAEEGSPYAFSLRDDSGQAISYTPDEETGVVRALCAEVDRTGALIGTEEDPDRVVWKDISSVTRYYGEGRSGWQDRSQGLRYTEYTIHPKGKRPEGDSAFRALDRKDRRPDVGQR